MATKQFENENMEEAGLNKNRKRTFNSVIYGQGVIRIRMIKAQDQL